MAARSKATAALGEAIRELREGEKLGQERAALQSGVDRAYFSAVERGQHSPGFETLLKISSGIGVPAAKIVERAEQKLR